MVLLNLARVMDNVAVFFGYRNVQLYQDMWKCGFNLNNIKGPVKKIGTVPIKPPV